MDRQAKAGSDPLADSLSSLSLNQQSSIHSPSPQVTTNPPANTSLERPRPASSLPSSSLVDPPLARLSPSNQTFVLFQPECIKHRYIRAQHDISEIVERPERIRAITAGVAASWARNERIQKGPRWTSAKKDEGAGDGELGDLMKSLSIGSSENKTREIKGSSSPFDILSTSHQLPLSSPALQLIHSLPNNPPPSLSPSPPPSPSKPSRRTSLRSSSPSKPYPSTSSTPWPQQLLSLISSIPSPFPTTPPTSEIPSHLPQGDLYLCRESGEAIFGALGAVARGVDLVVEGTREKEKEGYRNGFIVVRPPGHHCGEANPQGFCFVNNVAVAAAHAHLEHGINKVIILDIDLHHGNGTQEIVWKINETANSILLTHEAREQQRLNSRSPRKSSPLKTTPPPTMKEKRPKPLQIMYGSLHDVLSFPCESGDTSMVQAASLNISGPHNQYISNLHLEPYSSEQDFKERLWPTYWEGLGGKAEEFLRKTRAEEEETLVLVSTGFDASPHEYESMSRHGLNVPTSFYSLFSKRIKEFSNEFAEGRLLFVLEGGYSDKALVSGSIGILEGLLDGTNREMGDDDETLEKIVKACGLGEKVTGGKGGKRGVKQEEGEDDWIKRTKEVFEYLSPPPTVSSSPSKAKSKPLPAVASAVVGAGGGPRQGLRERKQRVDYAGLADMPSSFSTSSSNTNSPQQQLPPHPSTAPSLPPPVPSSTPTAFSAIPPASFFSSNGASGGGGGGGGGEVEKKKPSVKFVWKQGGIGGSAKDEPRM